MKINVLGFVTAFVVIICLFGYVKYTDRQIERDKQKYDRISSDRLPGTKCRIKDAVSVKRRFVHPRWPAGGWGKVAEIDIDRHRDTAGKNVFTSIGGEIAGYVQFPVPGKIIMRCYDDMYGDVYCGWSPVFVQYEPQPKPVYVVFSTCAMGDGGLDQVHELCWFPEGKDEGVILYSSAHAEKNDLEPYEVFLPRHIGVFVGSGETRFFFFSNYESSRVLKSLLRAGKIDQARRLVTANIGNARYLPSGVDGSTQALIPAEKFHCEIWANLLLVKAGIDVFDYSSQESLLKAKDILAKGKDFCIANAYTADLLDLYLWVADSVQGKQMTLPDIPGMARRVHGHDPHFIVKILSDSMISDITLGISELSRGVELYFWLGLREYISGNCQEALRYLYLFINKSTNQLDSFELAAAATLVAQIENK
jgi:hypothetical protein